MTTTTTQPGKRKIERVRLDDLHLNPRNPRTHSDRQIEQIANSMRVFGWTNPMLVDESNEVIAGHGRYAAARKLDWQHGDVIRIADLTQEQKTALMIADNQLAANAGWDDALLREHLTELKAANFDVDLLGFSDDDWAAMMEQGAIEQADSDETSDGSLLGLLNVAVAEPSHKVQLGDVWKVGRHVLLCCSVMTDWHKWARLLVDDAVFCPYPGPFVPLGLKAEEHRLVMVQPNGYIAGHVLDRYAEVKGESEVALEHRDEGVA